MECGERVRVWFADLVERISAISVYILGKLRKFSFWKR